MKVDAAAQCPVEGGRLPERESPSTYPKDGREFRVRIGTRWFRAAFVEDITTGARFLGAKLASDDWVRIAEASVAEWRMPASARCSAPSGRLSERESEGAQEKSEQRAAATPAPAQTEIYKYAEVHNRIIAMVRTLKFMHDPEWRFLSAGGRVNWPATIYDAEDLKNQRENHSNRDDALQPPRFRPTPADLTRLDATVAWFQLLDPLDAKQRAYLIKAGRQPLSPPQLLVWRVALGASFHSLSKLTGDHHETIRRRFNRAIERLHAIANAQSGAAGHRHQRAAENRGAGGGHTRHARGDRDRRAG